MDKKYNYVKSGVRKGDQGNYCKIEKGNRRFSYYEIKELYKSDFDVNYIEYNYELPAISTQLTID